MGELVEVTQEDRPRCLCCRRPFDAHLVDEDYPGRDTMRICPRPPSQRERYLPDDEHAALCVERDEAHRKGFAEGKEAAAKVARDTAERHGVNSLTYASEEDGGDGSKERCLVSAITSMEIAQAIRDIPE